MLMLWAYLELAARAARRRRRPVPVPVVDLRRRCACTRCAADRAFSLIGPITPGDATVPRGNRRFSA